MRYVVLVFCLFVASCYRAPRQIEPCLVEPPHPKEVFREARKPIALPCDFSVSPFCPLTAEEKCTDWGKELTIALCFAGDFDLYRAITSFKRALFLMPPCCLRRLEVEYDIALAYYLGKKYVEAVHAVEGCELIAADPTFPAFSDLLLLLYDSYHHLCQEEKALHILSLMDPSTAEKISLLLALQRADLNLIYNMGESNPEKKYLADIACKYRKEAKSVRKAEFLNTILPGAGYWYVGQKNTAVTALLVNSLFIAAATEFFLHGYTAAGVITLSLESGWYFGGIYGAGLAAKYHNERLYGAYAERIIGCEKNIPLMMLRYSF